MLFGCKKSSAYKMIRETSNELKKSGYSTYSGRVPTEYFLSRYGFKVIHQKEGKNEHKKN